MTRTPGTVDAAAQRAERRQLTVMFCDLVGSTALSVRHDPEEIRDLITAYRQTCASVIKRFNGFIARYVGDGILIYFGYPQAQEFEAESAVRAGLEIIREITKLDKPELKVRVSIATGTVVVGDIVGEGTEERDAVVGETPNLAARLLKLARPGAVVVSESTKELLADLFEFHDLGPSELRGFSRPVRVWQLVRESNVKSRSQAIQTKTHLTTLVAREDDIEGLRLIWKKAVAGKGQVYLISGEAGIGKSRLLRQFKNEIQESYTVNTFYCSANHRDSALYPIISRLTDDAKLNSNDTNLDKIKKVEENLNPIGIKTKKETILLLDLLSIDFDEKYQALNLSPDVQKSLTFNVLEQHICQYASNEPALLIFEDLHWSDPSTLELIDRLVLDRVQDLPMLVLVTCRPEFVPAWPAEHYITHNRLKRLSPADAETLLMEMDQGKFLTPPLIKEIINKSDRIPLYLEEIFKATNENIILGRNEDQFNRNLSGIPSMLAGSLMERLDRLEKAKDVTQVAAAIGQLFTFEILEDLVPLGHEELQKALDRLVHADIIRRRGAGVASIYIFKHSLIRDAAYSSLLLAERIKLHASIAQLLEKKHPDVVKQVPERLAHHYSEAGLIEQAISYWQIAGERARERFANSEAIGHVSKALDLLENLTDDEVKDQKEMELRTTLALSLTALKGGGAEEVKANYSRARLLSQRSNDASKQFTIVLGSWLNSFMSANLIEAQLLSSELLELAELKGNESNLVEAKRIRGMTMLYLGEFTQSRSFLERAIELHDVEKHKLHALRYGLDPLICCESYLAYALWFLGCPELAVARCQHAVTAARSLKHPYTRVLSLAYAAFLHQNLEIKEKTKELANKAIRISEVNEFQYWAKQQSVLRSWAQAELNKSNAGVQELRQAVDAYLEIGPCLQLTRALTLMAEIYIKHDQFDECLKMLDKAMEIANNTGEKYYLAEIHRLHAELLICRNGVQAIDKICAQYRFSLDIAEYQGAVSWQFKSARSIAAFCQNINRLQEDSDRLLRLCERGFDGGNAKQVIGKARLILDKLQKA